MKEMSKKNSGSEKSAPKVTISVIKADIGGYVGHSSSHPDILKKAETMLAKAKQNKLLNDFCVTSCGDDLELIMTHKKGCDSSEIHGLAWKVFEEGTALAKKMKLYGAGQDMLADAFSGNVKGMGPGVAEMEIVERKSEPIIVFMGDKCAPGAWNFPLFKMFADPFNTIGLIIDPSMHDGFKFEIHDIKKDKNFMLSTPEEMYDLLVLIGSAENYIIKAIYTKKGEIAASSSTQKLYLIAGRYVGKDDPVLIVRGQSGLPAMGEILEPFSFPHLVTGWMRGSHYGPLMPTSQKEANPTRFDGPPRVIAFGFQVSNGMLVGPRDMFDDPSYDYARTQANKIANFMRAHGPFEPHRLPLTEMEYTTLPEVIKKLAPRMK
jgi:fructose 1,6-bisphosphate aldolase/phosphatase